MPFPPPEDLPDPGIETASFTSPVLAGRVLTTQPPGKPQMLLYSLPTAEGNYSRHKAVASGSGEKESQETGGNRGGKEEGKHKCAKTRSGRRKLSLDLFITKCGGQEVRAATLFLGGPHALAFCL